jgi:FKBP-type peptidyl-prolyl cis-trans isomerase FklB
MKSHLFSMVIFGCLANSLFARNPPELKTPGATNSYALGMDIVATLQQQGVEIDTRALAAGVADTLAGKCALTPEQQKSATESFSRYLQERSAALRKVSADRNLQEGQAFLAANAKKPGVQVMPVTAPDGTPTEMQYQILQSGSGQAPAKDDILEVQYTGNLIDGTIFDSSIKRNIPVTIGLDKAIPGWAAALQKMKAGDKWRLFIPPALGYGASGFLKIPPNSTLIFDLELLSFRSPHRTDSAPVTNPPPAQ